MERCIGEAIRDDAHRKLMTSFELQDWRLAGNESRDDLAFIEPARKMSIEVEADRINIFQGDPSKAELVLWIELTGGELAVHAYDAQHEEPLTLRISDADIRVDDQR